MENPLIAAETVRKASLSNLHTHEATGSSPVVSTMTALRKKCGLFCFLEESSKSLEFQKQV